MLGMELVQWNTRENKPRDRKFGRNSKNKMFKIFIRFAWNFANMAQNLPVEDSKYLALTPPLAISGPLLSVSDNRADV